MPTLLAFVVDDTGRRIIHSIEDDLRTRGPNGSVLGRYPDLWAADISLWQDLELGKRDAAIARWTSSPANVPTRIAIENGAIQPFLEALLPNPDALADAAAPLNAQPLPPEYRQLHGDRDSTSVPTDGIPLPWLRALNTVRTSGILIERMAALTWLLDNADQPLGGVLGHQTALRSQVDAELGAIITAWHDISLARTFAACFGFAMNARVAAARHGVVAVWLQNMLRLLFPTWLAEEWLTMQSARHDDSLRSTLDSALSVAVYRNARGPTPCRPLPLILVNELKRMIGEDQDGSGRRLLGRDLGDIAQTARWALAASGAGWLTGVAAERQRETVRWMLDQIRADPRTNLAFAQTLAREQAALDDDSRSAVGDEIEFLFTHEPSKYIDVLLLLLPIVVSSGTNYVNPNVVAGILVRAGEASVMKEGLRGFGEAAARAARWDHWEQGLHALVAVATSAAESGKRRLAALLTLEQISEARRSHAADEQVRAVANRALGAIQQAAPSLGDDLDLKRELWRASREK